MAAASGAFGVKAGYNQSAGGYYTVVADIPLTNFYTLTPGTGSGGAATVGTFAAYSWTNDLLNNTSSVLLAGRLLKDMGRTIVSSGRTFRKFQGVYGGAALNSFGVAGVATNGPTGYVTGYLEVSREGLAAGTRNQLARAF